MENNNHKGRLRTAFLLFPFALIAATFFPFIISNFINRRLKSLPGYYGHLHRVRCSPFTSSIKLTDLFFNKTDETSDQEIFFFRAGTVKIKMHWMALWNGKLEADVFITAPYVNFVKIYGRAISSFFQSTLDIDIPFDITCLQIDDGTIEFIDENTHQQMELQVSNINIEGSHLTNIAHKTNRLPSEVKIKGNAYSGKLDGNIKLGFIENMPAFDLNLELTGVDMTRLNTFFRWYGKFDVSRGTLSLFTEIATRDGRFTGYVKPIINHLEILEAKDLEKGFASFLWESLLAFSSSVLENHRKDQLATKIHFEGAFHSPKINTAYAIFEVLLNAFVHALKPTFDLDIDIHSVKKLPS